MDRRTTAIVLIAALTGVLFAAVTTSGGVGLWTEPQWEPAPSSPDRSEAEARETEPAGNERPTETDPLDPPGWLEAILNVLGVAALFLILAWLLRQGWRRGSAVRWGRPPNEQVDFDVLPDVAAAIVDEAAEHRAVLMRGSPRNAIVRCWVRLETDVADAGLVRDPSDTSAEFTERVLARYSVDPAAIHELGVLYREARFSEHPIGEDARDAALEALDRLHAALDRGAEREAVGAETAADESDGAR